ncbi:MAG: DUF4097 family beta strand repeat protein [candidate division WOR-3 bacterium]|nr:MAG: DUF4097 family beta strand repeat protein [candidate division WOR-3 bacterium]
MQILKMLEQGKINAQEAERLLEAVTQSEAKERKGKHKIWSSIEGIPKVISAVIGNAIDDAQCQREGPLQYPKKKKLSFNSISGDLQIIGTDTDKIEVQKDGLARIRHDDEALYIKTLSGDIQISLPRATEISIAGISGDMDISDTAGPLHIESVSGDVTGKNLSGSFSGEFVSGDIDLEYNKVDEINIRSRSGDVNLILSKKVEAKIELESRAGNISCEFELKDEERTDHEVKGIINRATGEIEIKSKSGNISVREKA